MKKTYVYFLVPLVALIAFGGYYWNFSSGYDQHLEDLANLQKKAKQEKLEASNKEKQKAYDEAVAASERRKQEKAAKEKHDAEEAEARELAVDLRNKANRDAIALTQKIERLTKDVDATKKELATLVDNKTKAVAEQAHLRVLVQMAQENTKGLEADMQKIKDADDAAVAAAKAAAAAAAAAKK
jgi:colicin import membrane protein